MELVTKIGVADYEKAVTKLGQLEALLAAATGVGFNHFVSLNSDLQDHLLLLAYDLAHAALESLSEP